MEGIHPTKLNQMNRISTSVDILIVTALPEELRALSMVFDLKSPTYIDGKSNAYYMTQLTSVDGTTIYSVAALCLNGMGNTNAGIVASTALRDLNPLYVFMFGLAGGIKEEINLGDVIVADKIFYHALGKYYPDRQEIRPEPLKTDAVLLQRFHSYCIYRQDETEYQVKVGPFAVGEQVISSAGAVEDLRKIHPKMLGIEMESYGVGLAVFQAGTPTTFMAIRGVSDFADLGKNDDYRATALGNAAETLIGFIKSGLLPKNNYSNPKPKFVAIHHLSLYRRPSLHQASRTDLKDILLFDLIEMPIMQTDLYDNGSLKDPSAALSRQQEMLARLEEFLHEYPKCELGYFGLAHIPLVFHMGYEINRREIQVFGNDYNSGAWFSLPDMDSCPIVHVEGLPQETAASIEDVFLVMSISYKINLALIVDIIHIPTVYVHIRIEKPQLGLVDCKDTLDRLTKIFRDTLQGINDKMPSLQRVHLFYAGPPTLAFRCGQQINRNIDPDIIVYNYSRRDNPQYRWGLNLQTGAIYERGENYVQHP